MNVSPRSVEIADQGRVQLLEEDGLRGFHGGAAVFGMTLGFRMLQYAASLFSTEDEVWDRSNLSIRSAHPGPGVRDAIEFVTRCVSRNAYSMDDSAKACHAGMRFEWTLTHGREQITLRLREGFIPARFLRLLERKNSGKAGAGERQALEVLKLQMSQQLWKEPLTDLFEQMRVD